MADPIYKVVEVVGTSEQSISKAIDNAKSRLVRSRGDARSDQGR